MVKRKARITRHAAAHDAYKQRVLKALAKGKSPTWAAEEAGIGRSTAWLWRKNDPQFAAAWDEAVAEGVDRLEDEAHRRAVEGYNPRPVYHKGRKVGEIREYSDSLLGLLLKSRRPEVYTRSHDGTTNVNVKMTLEESRERLRELGVEYPLLIEGDQVEDHTVVPQVTDRHNAPTDDTDCS
jgi:hypothetical protein